MNKTTKVKQGFLILSVVLVILVSLATLVTVLLAGGSAAILIFTLAIQIALLVVLINKKAIAYESIVVLGVIALSSGQLDATFLGIIGIVAQVVSIIFAWQIGSKLYPDRGIFKIGKKK